MDDGNPISGVIWILVLIFIKALVTTMKTAFMDLNESSIKKKADSGDRRAARLLKLRDNPDRYLFSLQLLLNITGIAAVIIYVTQIFSWVEKNVSSSREVLSVDLLKLGAYLMFTFILVLVMTLFATILPDKFAIKHSETIASHSLVFIRGLGNLLWPLTWLLEITMKGSLLLFGIKPSQLEDNVTEEEIISMVNEGQEQGVFDAGEAEMISNIIELDEKEAQDIMTHKKRIIAINSEMTLEEALRFMLSEKYSRYPLYEDNRDNIIGILHLKDVIKAYISEDLRGCSLKDIAREPYYVPDTQSINILFAKMQSKNIHMAIVIDEYGQTAGLVAMEDFIEEIVGNIQDEYDNEENMIISKGDSSCIVKGAISMEELEDELQIIIEQKDFDTLNGLLISILDRIPMDGETATLEHSGYSFDILEVKNKMIEKVRISQLPKDIEEKTISGEEDK